MHNIQLAVPATRVQRRPSIVVLVSSFTMLVILSVVALNWPQGSAVTHPGAIITRDVANSVVAGDIYGLGVRIGTYLQVLGMLLACTRSEPLELELSWHHPL
jgi:hypothetical protein